MGKGMGAGWRNEDDFETSKGMGLADSEARCFIGLYRYIRLVMLSHAFLANVCAEAHTATVVDAHPSPTSCIPSSIHVVDASPPLLVSGLAPPLIPDSEEACMLPAPQATLLPALYLPPIIPTPQQASLRPVPVALPSPPVINPAPPTIPEDRHLLGQLIVPSPSNA